MALNWSIKARFRDGTTYTLGATDVIWFSAGTGNTDPIVVGAYQDGMHISDNTDAHLAQCISATHVHNVKFIDSTHASVDGGSSVSLPLTSTQCPLQVTLATTGETISPSNVKIYGFDGEDDNQPWDLGGGFIYIGQGNSGQGGSSTWKAANGLSNALTLNTVATGTSFDYYIFLSISPGTLSTKIGQFKLSLTYI